MKIIRIILALVISLAMLYIARTNSRGQPEYYQTNAGPVSFEMVSVPKIFEGESDTIRVSVTGLPDDGRVLFRTNQNRGGSSVAPDDLQDFAALPMTRSASDLNQWLIEVTAGDKGGRFYYYFEAVDAEGERLGAFTAEDGSAFLLKYIGEVPILVLAGHLLFIFATVFAVSRATIEAVGVIRTGQGVRAMALWIFWATVFCFVGGYPLGIPMNWYAFGGTWEGVPFGTDATDNKTQLLFVFLLFATLSMLGSLSRGRIGRDIFRPRTLGWIGLGSFGVMLFIYLVPHSIQFEPGFTYAFCYTWIAVVAALFLLGWFRSARSRTV